MPRGKKSTAPDIAEAEAEVVETNGQPAYEELTQDVSNEPVDELDADEQFSDDDFAEDDEPAEVEADDETKQENEAESDADVSQQQTTPSRTRIQLINERRLAEQNRAETNKKRESKIMLFSQLQSALREKRELEGEVIAIVPNNRHTLAMVMWRGVPILIAFEEMYQDYPLDESSIHTASERTRRERQMMTKFLGAKINFLVTRVEGDYRNCAVAGSRKAACKRRAARNYDKDPYTGEARINIGDTVEANIINVGMHAIRADVQGMDVSIDIWRLSNRYIEDAKQIYKAGETIKVVIENIQYDAQGHALSIRASARRAETPDFLDNLNNLRLGSTTLARITSIQAYTRRDGTPGTRIFLFLESFDVPAYSTYTQVDNFDTPPSSGDVVVFSVRRKDEERGLAMGTILQRVS